MHPYQDFLKESLNALKEGITLCVRWTALKDYGPDAERRAKKDNGLQLFRATLAQLQLLQGLARKLKDLRNATGLSPDELEQSRESKEWTKVVLTMTIADDWINTYGVHTNEEVKDMVEFICTSRSQGLEGVMQDLRYKCNYMCEKWKENLENKDIDAVMKVYHDKVKPINGVTLKKTLFNTVNARCSDRAQPRSKRSQVTSLGRLGPRSYVLGQTSWTFAASYKFLLLHVFGSFLIIATITTRTILTDNDN